MSFFPLKDKVYWLVELPYRDNERNVSAIPVGEYKCKRRPSTKNLNAGYNTAFEITGVPGRSDILFAHIGNSVRDIRGCSAVGLKVSLAVEGVSNSPDAVAQYMKDLEGVNEFTLKIIEIN
jgi:hypothetical protein